MTTITIGTDSYNLVALPASPGFAAIEFEMSDAVSVVASPFTGQQQTQAWPGADCWRAKLTLPPMKRRSVDGGAWIAFLAGLRGMQNVFQLANPDALAPLGSALGVPVTSGTNNAMATSLTTSGWTASQFRLLVAGDHLQIGYRLHMVVDAAVDSDASGDATIDIWPSLREAPAAGTQIVLAKPMGLFRLASNQRGWQSSPRRALTMSFDVEEAR